MKWKIKCLLCLAPFCIGLLLFYILPFFKVLYYSIINNQFEKKIVGTANYINILSNQYFQLSMKNSILLIVICVPIMAIIAVIISWGVNNSKFMMYLSFSFILPVVIPTSAITPVWEEIFGNVQTALPMYLLFIFKNIGLNIVLISAAIKAIPTETYESAQLDGANKYQLFRYITIPCAAPSIIFSILLSIVNSFKIYKESCLYYGTNYPPTYSYTLQYYMNNNFLKLDYQALSCGAVINTLIILVTAVFMLRLQRKYSL